ncbi:MAG: apolipoprotein N-acyltransferase [Actinomycetota bacterium]|nr:apolipoprotein N-acyltransferase [Actinomycetota bacterium]
MKPLGHHREPSHTEPGGIAAQAPRGALAKMVAIAIVCGAGLALSLPPWGFWPLAPISAAVLYRVLENRGVRARALLGFCCGLGMFGPGLFWALSFSVPGGIVLIIAESCFVAVGAASVPPATGRVFGFTAAMTLAEAARCTWPFGGLPLGGVALGQAAGPLAPAARIGGEWLLVALVYLAGAGIAEVLRPACSLGRLAGLLGHKPPTGQVPIKDVPTDRTAHESPDAGLASKRSKTRKIPRFTAGAIALGFVVAVAGVAAVAPNGGHAIGTVNVAAVQGGGRRGFSMFQINPATVYEAQVAASRQLERMTARHPVSLVLWPEDTIALDGPLVGSPQEKELSHLARRLHATIAAGVTEPSGNTHFLNKIVAWNPSGRIIGQFEKVHRVPFGEYIPDRSFFSHLGNLAAVPRNAVPGHGSGLINTPVAPIGIMVSYEVFFPDRARSSVTKGAELLVVPTNTSSYSTSQVPTQEIAASRLRAIEEGRDLLQAAPTGYSAAITNNGKVLNRSVLGIRQLIIHTLKLRKGKTIYERLGDPPILILGALALIAGWTLELLRRKRTV